MKKDASGAQVLVGRAIRGRIFGEQALLPASDGRRQSSARALVRIRLLVYPREVLDALVEADRLSTRELVRMGGWRRASEGLAPRSGDLGSPHRRAVLSDGVVQQYRGDARLTTVLCLDGGDALIASRTADLDGHEAEVVRDGAPQSEEGRTIRHRGANGQLQFEASFNADNTLARYATFADGPAAETLYRLARSTRSLSPQDLDTLEETGTIELPPMEEEENLLCSCLQIPVAEVRGAIASGCRSLEALSEATGCGTVCGGCHRRAAELPHIQIAPRGRPEGVVDAVLRSQGMSRRVARAVPFFQLGLELAARSDYLLTVPERIALRFQASLGLKMFTLPVELKPYALSMVWHPRYDRDPGHRFVRDQLRVAFQSVGGLSHEL